MPVVVFCCRFCFRFRFRYRFRCCFCCRFQFRFRFRFWFRFLVPFFVAVSCFWFQVSFAGVVLSDVLGFGVRLPFPLRLCVFACVFFLVRPGVHTTITTKTRTTNTTTLTTSISSFRFCFSSFHACWSLNPLASSILTSPPHSAFYTASIIATTTPTRPPTPQ